MVIRLWMIGIRASASGDSRGLELNQCRGDICAGNAFMKPNTLDAISQVHCFGPTRCAAEQGEEAP